MAAAYGHDRGSKGFADVKSTARRNASEPP
jgi:hypothetical protein